MDAKGRKFSSKTMAITNAAVYVIGGLFKKVNLYLLPQ
jgi:hypothetical protein